MFAMWTILGVVAVILLTVYHRTKNAAWGGFTIGIIIGVFIALFSDHNWYTVGKGAISGTLIGFAAELFGQIATKLLKK